MSCTHWLILTNFLFVLVSSACYDKNCQTCSDSKEGSCTKCLDKYFLINGSCPCFQNICQSCTNSYSGSCESCKSGFALYKKSCVCNLKGCQFCNENGCDSCYPGYKLTKNICVEDTSTKITCSDSNCDICIDSTTSGCTSCKSGYYLMSGKCTANPACLNYKNGDCISCTTGYTPDYTSGKCEKTCLGQSCDNNNCQNKCLTCDNGILYQYLGCNANSVSKYCNDVNCENCYTEEAGACFRCQIGYRLTAGACQKCDDPNCIQCPYDKSKCASPKSGNYVLINGVVVSTKDTGTTPTVCTDTHCTSCFRSDYCSLCASKYSLSNGACYSCDISNCLKCLSDNVCSVCSDGYSLKNNVCNLSSCSISHCTSCATNGTCSECESGYTISSGTCQVKTCDIENCSQCTYDQKTCGQCNSGYYLNSSGTCVACSVVNCSICTLNSCYTCKDNYYLNDKNVCLSTSQLTSQIKNCLIYDSSGNCSKCESNCSLQSDGTCKCISITIVIVVVLLVVILGISIGLCCFCIKKKRQIEIMEREAAVRRENQINENRALQMQKLDQKEIDEIAKQDALIPKCSLCKKDSAIMILGCGCYLGNEQGKEYLLSDNELKEKELLKKEKPKCPCCKKEITSTKQIYFQCGICLEITTKVFHFNCNCAMATCAKCYNKCIDLKKCPGCRKDLIPPQVKQAQPPELQNLRLGEAHPNNNPQQNPNNSIPNPNNALPNPNNALPNDNQNHNITNPNVPDSNPRNIQEYQFIPQQNQEGNHSPNAQNTTNVIHSPIVIGQSSSNVNSNSTANVQPNPSQVHQI